MNLRQEQISKVRNRVMEKRKILCTGNPNKIGTIASGVKELWPDATFIHRSNGYDFWNLGDKLEELKGLFKNHNTFINASYVDGVQTKLLDICNLNMIVGDVFNIGSTNEYDNLSSEIYKNHKLALRELSLKLNTYRFQTCHIVMGGIDTGIEERKDWIKPKKIAEVIKWIMEQETFKIPIMGIDQPKQPW
tara:strand:+ start:127 stop:699 length:573 start_codon:yes stop_codon:yes gene_type:complete